MKTTDTGTKVPDKSDIVLFIVLAFFLAVVIGGIGIALFTWSINTLLVMFAIDMVPFSLAQGLTIWFSLWIIKVAIFGIRRPSKEGI
jgi:hypothetical protein